MQKWCIDICAGSRMGHHGDVPGGGANKEDCPAAEVHQDCVPVSGSCSYHLVLVNCISSGEPIYFRAN